MYTPAHFNQTDPQALREMIEANSFGTLISMLDDRPFATHLLFIYDPDHSRLLAHMARANPHWSELARTKRDALIIFQGPHAYISPSLYRDPGVPTWNYTAVHIYGRFRVLDDAIEHRQVMETLTAQHETQRPVPWQADFDSSMVQQMLQATVAFEIEISEVQGKFKLGQNRSSADRENVIHELQNDGGDDAAGLAQLMRETL